TLRNADVEALGLRRWFRVSEPRAVEVPMADDNFYLYGFATHCPDSALSFDFPPTETDDRARWMNGTLPVSASTWPAVCDWSCVRDALGEYEVAAIARKNPEVHPAFPELRSPVKQNTTVGFVLKPCHREISATHLAMQTQRLLLAGAPTVCIDDTAGETFVTE